MKYIQELKIKRSENMFGEKIPELMYDVCYSHTNADSTVSIIDFNERVPLGTVCHYIELVAIKPKLIKNSVANLLKDDKLHIRRKHV